MLAAALATSQLPLSAAATIGDAPPVPMILAARGDSLAPLRASPGVRLLAVKEPHALVTPAAVRAAPTPYAPVLATLPMGTAIEVDGRTADGAFLRAAATGATSGQAGWIWAALARRELPPPDPDVVRATAVPRAPEPPAPSAGERARQLKRYRQRFHAALRRLGLDPLSDDTATAGGMFRDIVGRVRTEHIRPVDLAVLIDGAIDGLEQGTAQAGPGRTSPHELMLASLRPALARLDGASTIMSPAELAAGKLPVDDRTRSEDDLEQAGGWPEEDPGQRTLFLGVTGFPAGTAAATESFIARELQGAGSAIAPVGAFVLDLRGNSGGLLEEAVAFADLFLPAGEIGRTVTRRPGSTDYHMGAPGELLEGVPMVVLVDEGTASGAELVAGALQLTGRALLAGRATPGAAAVQTIMPLVGDHGALRLTTGRLTLADGQEFACRGLAPDILLDDSAGPAAVADALRRAGCAEPRSAAVDPRSAETCPIPGGEAGLGEVACVIRALQIYVLAPPSGR